MGGLLAIGAENPLSPKVLTAWRCNIFPRFETYPLSIIVSGTAVDFLINIGLRALEAITLTHHVEEQFPKSRRRYPLQPGSSRTGVRPKVDNLAGCLTSKPKFKEAI